MSRLLTFEEAAELKGVPRAALRREAEHRGLLTRVGRAVRIHEDDLVS